MIPDATFGPTSSQSTIRIRFSLFTFLLFVTLVCVVLAWWLQPNRVVATALFRVHSTAPAILTNRNGGIAQHGDQRDFERVKKTQIALIRSPIVLQAALRKPGISTSAMLNSQIDPAEWIEEHLEVQFPEAGEILALSLHGIESQSTDLVRIVDAVAKAYVDEVLYAEKQQRMANRDLLARSLYRLNDEISRKAEEVAEISRESGGLESARSRLLQDLDIKRLDRIEAELMRLESDQLDLDTSGTTEDLKFLERRIAKLRERQSELENKILSRTETPTMQLWRYRELEQLQRVANEMSIRLETLDIESQAPGRIQFVQSARISSEE